MFESYAILREVKKNEVRSLHVILLNSLEGLHYGRKELVALPEETTRAKVVGQVKKHLEQKGIPADLMFEGEEAIVVPLPDNAEPFERLRYGLVELLGRNYPG
jgi:hypothetical protein